MGKTNEGFGGFDAVFANLGHEVVNEPANLSIENNADTDSDSNAEPANLDFNKGKQKETESNINPDALEATSNANDKDEEFDDEIPETSKTKQEVEQEESTESVEINENEQESVKGFFDAFAETLGWEVSDDEKPNSVEELVDYVKQVVEENSKPQFASEDIAAINEYVSNGGKVEDYLSLVNEVSDYTNLDITDENNQKRVLKDYLATTGLSETQISRKISKYEDAGLLEDEAEEALEYMQDLKAKEKEQLLADQEKYATQQKEEQQKFYNSVLSEIENLNDVRGIPVSKEDRNNLKNYLFKVESDGKTKYQKDYSKSVRNLIESAYFTQKGDALINSAKKTGETSAVKALKERLTTTKRNGSKQTMNDGSPTPVWAAASFLQKPTN